MILIIRKDVANRVGYEEFVPYGLSTQAWKTWMDQLEIDLTDMSEERVDALEEMLHRHERKRGVGVLIADVTLWKKILAEGASESRPRTVRQFETMLKQYLLRAPGHRVYIRHGDGHVLCSYVTKTEYSPPYNSSDRRKPAEAIMYLAHEETGGTSETSVIFTAEDCLHTAAPVALAQMGYSIETPELRQQYLDDKERFVEVASVIGRQYWGRGRAFTLERQNSWDSPGTRVINLDPWDEPSRVIVDRFAEEGERKTGRSHYVDRYFWRHVQIKSQYDPYVNNDTEEAKKLQDKVDDRSDYEEVFELPIHPWIVVFHLAKHARMRVHVRQLELYVYDDSIADKLILPDDHKQLVKLLIETKGGAFKDIVRGKGGGAVVLLSGLPGTGKTLTAEVYAESEHKALYSVQCSQLGTDPVKLESALLGVFDRARRWDVVMLLDEADVYVHERGSSMDQNAIVGVFLRVLEYQVSTLFLTTNRPDDVDDAIASRCIARLNYSIPTAEQAKEIWRVLVDGNTATISEDVLDEVVRRYPALTGRDIKNILKLGAVMMNGSEGLQVSDIEYVQQFKPTGKANEADHRISYRLSEDRRWAIPY